MRTKEEGFTLIQTMLVLTIVGILAGIALPAYQEWIQAARRSDAITALLEIQLAQEKWRARSPVYGGIGDLRDDPEGDGVFVSTGGYYALHVTDVTAGAYLAAAVPLSGRGQVSDPCGSFALDQDGPVHQRGGVAYANAGCWRN